MTATIKATDAHNSFNELVNRVRYGKERLIITHHNQEAAALISSEDLALLEQLESALRSEKVRDVLKTAIIEEDESINLAEIVTKFGQLQKDKSYNFSDLVGTLEWQGDAVATQRTLRDEW